MKQKSFAVPPPNKSHTCRAEEHEVWAQHGLDQGQGYGCCLINHQQLSLTQALGSVVGLDVLHSLLFSGEVVVAVHESGSTETAVQTQPEETCTMNKLYMNAHAGNSLPSLTISQQPLA